jgi:hypothetical protein
MTLTEYPDLIQGSDEWLAARCGILTASVVGQLITPKTIKVAANVATRALTAGLVADRINGWTEDHFSSYDMNLGHEIEPLARDLYSRHYGTAVTEVGFMSFRDRTGREIGYSPDGLVGDDGLIEIKKHKPKIHLAAVCSGVVPSEHIGQIQCGLYVSGREWCDYLSYSPGMHLWVKRVLPDPEWFAAIIEAVDMFENAATQMVGAYLAGVDGLPATERITYDAEMTF